MRPLSLKVLLTAATTGVVAWIVLAVWVSGRGFGGPNEGFYLLSYANWDENPRTFTMMQYYYGPLFDWFGQDLAKLRIFRLLTVVGSHAFFAWHFMMWHRSVRPRTDHSRLRELVGAMMIVAAGGVIYGWLPPSPGYNDVSILGAITLSGCLFALLSSTPQPSARVLPVALLMGFVGTAMVLSKATTIVCVVVLILVSGIAGVRSSRGRTLFAFGVVSGGLALALVLHALVMPLDESLPPFIDTLQSVQSGGYGMVDVVTGSALSTLEAIALGVLSFVVPGLLMALVLRVRTGRMERGAPYIGIAINLVLLALAGGFQGGLGNVGAYQAGLAAALVVCVGVALARLGGQGGALGVATLVITPWLAAAGTGNPLPAVAVGGAALWVAVMFWVWTGTESGGGWPALTSGAALLSSVAICVSVGVTGVTHTPDGRNLLLDDRREISGVPLLASIEVPSARAREIEAVRMRLRNLVEPPGRPMMAFGELSDYVLLLNGQPIGNAWYAQSEGDVRSADLRAACEDGNPWGARQPVVLTRRPLTPKETAGFRACGIDLASDYSRISLVEDGVDFWALVPRRDS